jgi:hypothetical protein
MIDDGMIAFEDELCSTQDGSMVSIIPLLLTLFAAISNIIFVVRRDKCPNYHQETRRMTHLKSKEIGTCHGRLVSDKL